MLEMYLNYMSYIKTISLVQKVVTILNQSSEEELGQKLGYILGKQHQVLGLNHGQAVESRNCEAGVW